MKTDLEIQQDLINELKWQPFLKSANIGVAVKNGVVTLSGNVDSYSQKIGAEKAARKVTGVRAIAEDIQIGVSPALEKTDVDIAESVVNALKWHAAVPEERIKVKVENGIVTLEGEVEWEYQRSSTQRAVNRLLGVRNVVNLINIKPRVTAFDVRTKIFDALRRTATTDAERVSIEVDGSKVILNGKVRSFTEKEDVEDAAWCAPGVSRVESHLEVEPVETFAF
jgi:osmotically-inducible protein OsmY